MWCLWLNTPEGPSEGGDWRYRPGSCWRGARIHVNADAHHSGRNRGALYLGGIVQPTSLRLIISQEWQVGVIY